ncbi:MAG TPA: C-GCAxxG-C-C family protein [bacterium]|nr:C-GCAxxG-C-C family protein [bacterium]
MGRTEQARACFADGFNCAQALVAIYGPIYGIDRGMGLRIGAALGAGLARSGATCGAVTGALVVIGLKHGMTRKNGLAAKEKTYALAREFMERFAAAHGTLLCRELLGCALDTPEGLQFARDNNLFTTRCAQYVADAAGIIEEILGIQ